MTPVTPWALHSPHFPISLRGHDSEAQAWRTLLGPTADPASIADARAMGWVVDQCPQHPRERREAA